MIRQIALVGAAIGCLAGPAFSQGYDRQFKYQTSVSADGVDWSGFYAGLHSGGVTGKTIFIRQTNYDTNSRVTCSTPGAPSCGLVGAVDAYRNAELGGAIERTVDIDGFHVGPHVGYQKQFGKLVLGADIGFSIGGGDGRTDCSNSAIGGMTATCESEYKYSVNARARLGYASGNYLFYATGGIIQAKLENRVHYTLNATGETLGEVGSAHPNGYLVGLGVEYQSASGMRFGIGYTHIFLEDVTVRLSDPYGGGSVTRTTPDPDVLGGALRIPLQQQAPTVQDPGPPAAQAPAVARAQVAPPARPAVVRPAAARPAATPPPAAARQPVSGQPKEPDEPEVKGKPSK